MSFGVPNVLVLLPVRNGSKTIGRAARSLCDQTHNLGLFRVSVIDNNSTDGSVDFFSLAVLNHKNRHQLNWDHSQQNVPGIVPALNYGLVKSSYGYQYIARIDADDIWYPEKLEKQIAFLDANPDIDIVGTQIRQVDTDFNPLPNQMRYPTDDKTIKEWLLTGRNPIAHPSVVFRRKIIDRTGGYDNMYPMAEDYHLWLKAMRWYNFANLDEVLIDYTVSHNPNYNPLSPQLACMAAKQAYQRLHGEK